jgi:hypothetical protein
VLFLIQDRVKLIGYRIFRGQHSGWFGKRYQITEGNIQADLTPRITRRAYELYEQRGRQDGRAVQDWNQAEREIRENEAKAGTKPENKK